MAHRGTQDRARSDADAANHLYSFLTDWTHIAAPPPSARHSSSVPMSL
jgi:hypothetical protein